MKRVSLICLVALSSIGVNALSAESKEKKKPTLEDRLEKIQKAVDWLATQYHHDKTQTYKFEGCHADCEKSSPWPNWDEVRRVRPKNMSDEDWAEHPANREFDQQQKRAHECHKRCEKLAPIGYRNGGC